MKLHFARYMTSLLLVCSLSVPVLVRATTDIPGSPKIINLFLNWQLREEDLPKLARWDVIVLDADQQTRYPDRVRRLRELHPNIKILAYIPSEEIASNRFSEPPEYVMAKLAARIQDAWYLRDPSGNPVYFWPGSAMLNVTNRGPAGAFGERWNTFLPRFIHEEILSTGLWDGVFLDNTFEGVSHYAKSPVDLDRNGVAESKADADAAWREGMNVMIQRLTELNPNAIIVGNGGAVYGNKLHGAFFEHFPSWSWAPNWKEFRETIAKNRKPSYTALNMNTDNVERPNAYQLMRYGLANAMIGGGYYSFDRGDYGHEVIWWYDEYTVSLGAARAEPRLLGGATGAAIVPGVWMRDFERGVVLLNSGNSGQKVPLPGVFEAIRGTQDPGRNSGAVMTSIELPPQDGVLLLRRAEATQLTQAAFMNGAFIRVFDGQGHQTQNGFFAQRFDAPSGAVTVVSDLDGDGKEETIIATQGRVTVQSPDSAKSTTFTPFGSRYRGRLTLAVGQANRDAPKEIIVGREGVAPPEVRVYSRTGKLLAAWNAYIPIFAGGARVAIGDLNGDGLREIVTGAGPGGGPHIRIWKTDGAVWGGSFMAFDPTNSGGVSVALGDVNGDRKDEIIVGSGQGAIPRVRIFDYRGILQTEFSLGTRPVASGIQVMASDLNRDGKSEILVAGLPAL